MAALLYRERTGEAPGYVEVPMFELMAAFSLCEHLGAATFEEDGKVGYVRVLSPSRRPYKTKDGWVGVLPYTRAQLDQGADRDRPRRRGGARLVQERHRAQPARRRALRHPGRGHAGPHHRGVARHLRAPRHPLPPVRSPQDLLADPHLADVGFFALQLCRRRPVQRTLRQAVNVEAWPAAPDLPPPLLGADTAAVLREAGCSEAEIAAVLPPAKPLTRAEGRCERPEARAPLRVREHASVGEGPHIAPARFERMRVHD